MSRRRRIGLSPSLFPFLAVLVCTLGTLILLLALVAQNATTAAEQNARSQQQAMENREAEKTAAPRMTRAAVEELLRDEEFRVQELIAIRDQQTADVESKRDELTHLDDHIARLSQQIEQLNDEIRLATGEVETPNISHSDISEIQEQVAAEKEKVDKLREDDADKTPRIVIVPHKGPNGTARRPIYLECTSQGIMVWPEGSPITLDQLKNASYSANPLDAALRTIRMHAMQNYGDSVPPYPLLVVRPDGIESYGAARIAMRDWDDQFGYELVPAGVKLAFPEPDANLKRRIDLAIRNAVAEQRVRLAMSDRATGRSDIRGDSHRGGGGVSARPLPVLSAAALDRAGRASGYGPLRDEYRGPATRSPATGSSYSSGPAVGSISRNVYPNDPELTDAGADARRMAQQMQAAAQELRSNSDGTTLGNVNGGSGQESTVNNSAMGKHYADLTPSMDLPNLEGSSATGTPPLDYDIDASNLEVEGAGNQHSIPDLTASVATEPHRDMDAGTLGVDTATGSGSSMASGAANGFSGDQHQDAPESSEAPTVASSAPGASSSIEMPMMQSNQPAPGMQGSPTMMGSPMTMIDESLSADPRLAEELDPSLAQSAMASSELVERHGRDWALPSSMAGMRGNSIIRTIRIQCYPDRFVLLPSKSEGSTEVFGFLNGDVDRASLELATALRNRIEKWGPALPGGKWQPRLEVEIKPNSVMRFHQLRTLMSGSGIELVGRHSP